MTQKDSYEVVARAYADGVRTLFAPPGPATRERGVDRGPASYEGLAKKAEALSGVSDNLGKEIAAQLSAPDPSVRMEGSNRMLAKALMDLEVSAQLLQAAKDEQQKTRFDTSRGAERGGGDLGAVEEYLGILLGEGKGVPRAAERGRKPTSIKEARMMLSTSLDDTLTLISDRASRVTQSAIGGLLGLGAGELAKAAGTLGINLAEMLGQAEKVSRLYELFKSFVSKVYDALVALIGESLMQKAGQKVVEFVNELKGGKYLPEILETLYQTKPTKDELKKFVDDSNAAIDKFNSAIQAVEGLNEGYGSHVKLVEKLLKGLKFIGGVSEMIIPQGKLILAAAYVGLGGYVVLAGADYVDSPNIRWLDRVVGVRRTVEGSLKTA